ncbi:hypothetical protein AGR4C_Cc80384 [Agrobacterium tumefaciens str. Kerr 14]|uniref:Uncharacterized protein n=1 Tax=Agrobacterium tumefaciens str. Kerr 14 TaxID=1183424 RepID=A0A1S7QR19_AGRTU|nr:hypothetical protein AGR4C_Cc80384 [Agrobacterium tumefaciens str. Kerr 14]
MVWRPYSQAPVAPQAEKLIFFASRRVFLWKPKGLWKTAPGPAKALKFRRYRCALVMPSCLVEGPGVLFPTLSWHLPPAGKNRRYDLSKGGKASRSICPLALHPACLPSGGQHSNVPTGNRFRRIDRARRIRDL